MIFSPNRFASLTKIFSRPRRVTNFLVVCLTLLFTVGFVFIQFRSLGGTWAFAGADTPKSATQTVSRLSERVTVQAAGRGRPYINFGDGHEVLTGYAGDPALQQLLEQNLVQPLAMASGDFDEDGVPDLISAYAGPSSGVFTLHRGNVDSIYPNAPEAQQRRATGVSSDAPFLSPARVFDLPVAADFVGAGDFDADGHWDVVIATRGDNALHFLAGDGKGNFGRAQQIELPGRVTAMATGEVNRADGLVDVVVGVATASGPRALVFESPEGALRSNAESFDLPDQATAIAIGNLDAEYTMDIAIAAGRELVVINGRDRKLSLDEKQPAAVQKARTSLRAFSFGLKSLAIGDFKGDHNVSLAVLTDQGSVHLLSAVSAKAKKKGIKKWKDEAWASGGWAQATQMVRTQVSSASSDDLVIVDGPGHKLHIVATAAASQQRQARISQSVSFDVEDEPMAVMPLRLNSDALSDLVVLRKGQVGPTVMTSQPALIFTVNTNADNVAGSLRDAINQANTNPGLDTINFAIGTGPQTITPASPLPTITEAVTIDGTTQPNFVGDPIIELNGTAATGADGLLLASTGCTVQGLVINRFLTAGIGVIANGNIVRGNFIGTDLAGTAGLANHTGIGLNNAASNTIGGTAGGARNVISGNTTEGVILLGNSTANQIQGNFIGADRAGTTDLGNGDEGVQLEGVAGNTIGGTTAGAGNLISGNNDQGILARVGASGNLVQGNFIGTNAAGTAAIGNNNDGIFVQDAPNNTLGGTAAGAGNLFSGNLFNGIEIVGVSGNVVQGNLIGTNATGNSALGNSGNGVTVQDSTNNTIGGTTASAANVISGNGGDGLGVIGGSDNKVAGNLIGTNAAGTAAIPNVSNAVSIVSSTNNQIGGAAAGAGNILSGNGNSGLGINGGSTNTVQGNFIGTNATGTAALANAGNGVAIGTSTNNTIGGATAAARNLISGNGVHGVVLATAADGNTIQGNFLGLNVAGNAAIANVGSGITIFDSSNVIITGNVISGNGDDGVHMDNTAPGGQNNTVRGNFIGTNPAGTASIPNADNGVVIFNMPNNIIGGTMAAERNIISGNGSANPSSDGVEIGGNLATGTQVLGNFIGTDVTGTLDLGNSGSGVLINDAPNSTIGGTSAGTRNLISGNDQHGVLITSSLATNNTVQGNFIGTDVNGLTGLGNFGDGVKINGADNNTIGGTGAGAGNLIAFSVLNGVHVEASTGNAVLSNSIFSSALLGIELSDDGVTPNDPGDGDTGSNNLQNFPVVTSASSGGGNTNIQGTLNSTPNTTFRLEFFSNATCDASGNGEGQTFIGSTNAMTDGSGNVNINVNFPVSLSGGSVVTATATDPGGNTSEFSQCSTVSSSCSITCPPNQTKTTGPSGTQCGAAVNYPAPTTVGVCGIVACTPASGSFFSVGTTPVTCQVQAGPSCSFIVTVVDDTPPKVTCPASIVAPPAPGQNSAVVDYVLATASDNCPGATVICLPPSGTVFTLGVSTVTCTGKDASNNTSVCTFTVTITNTPPPLTISCPPNVLAAASQGQSSAVVSYPAPTVTPTNATVACTPPSGSSFPVGTTTVNCTARDALNNTSSCSFSVTVNQGNPSVDKTTVDFGNPIAVPNQNPPTGTFTITNASAASVDLTLASIRRTGSDVGGRITNPDDSGFFTLFAVNPGSADSRINPGSTITIPTGQRTFRVMFNPSIPAVAAGTSNLSASQVLPDVVTSSLNFTSSGGALTVNLTGRVATGLLLIDPANPTHSPVVTFTKSGNQFNLTYSVFDPNLNVTRASHQFLDSSGQPSGQPIDVNLAQALQAINLVKGQSFTVDQPFTGASSHPEIAGVRLTVFDGETSVSATATLGSSAASNAPADDGRERMTLVLPKRRIRRFAP